MSVRPDVGLERLLQGLERELLEAPDEEFMTGARDLGMRPEMRGTAAFVGVKDLSAQLLVALWRAYEERNQDAEPAAEDPDGRRPRPGLFRKAKNNADV
jgi:hypothetical protein